MQDASFTLGSISLQDFEIPQYVRFGGRQKLALHSLADGRRIVERLGPDDTDIQFQGIFSGPNAENRVKAFDDLRLSGNAVWLTWESFRRKIIVRRFEVIYQSRWWISYQISCTVVEQRRTASSTMFLTSPLVLTDLSSALIAASGTAISLKSLQAALSSQNAQIPGTTDHRIALATAAATLEEANSRINNQSAMLVTPLPQSNGYPTISTGYASKVSLAGALATAIAVRSYVGRIQLNLSGLTV